MVDRSSEAVMSDPEKNNPTPKPQRTLKHDPIPNPPSEPSKPVDREALTPPVSSATDAQKRGAGALTGRAAIGVGLAALTGALIWFMLPSGHVPAMAVPTAVPAVEPTQAPKATAAAMVEVKAVATATDDPKPTNAPTSTAAAKQPTATAEAVLKPTDPPVASTATTSDTAAVAPTAVVSTTTAAPAETAPAPVGFASKTDPAALAGLPRALFGPNYDPADGKPVFTCMTDPSAAHLTLLQMQTQGLDIANGFHLGLVPIELNDGEYGISEDDYALMMREGKFDCIFERIDENVELDFGHVTAVLDESAGGNGIWGRGIQSYYDLNGKTVGYRNDSSAKYFVKYVLSILPGETRKTVTAKGYDTMDEMLAAFDKGEIDAVSAWQPFLGRTAAKGGAPIVTSDQLRIISNAVVVSKKALADKKPVIQNFHRAYFQALKAQIEDPDAAAEAIAKWGHNAWSGVPEQGAGKALREILSASATATLEHNVALMKSPGPFLEHMNVARGVRAASGDPVAPTSPRDQLVEAFVLALADDKSLASSAKPLNATFSLAPDVELESNLNVQLPCRNFTFLPNSAELTDDSKRVLDLCVLPVVQQRAKTELEILGSAAWPRSNDYSESQIRRLGEDRARAVADYLVTKGIPAVRLNVTATVPPEARRRVSDERLMAQDRYVQMTLKGAQ
jgi:outer membrane protein OmpA-like peptidoglycan-associated protein/ABC-type amino acid transport substrate-binding protein